MDGSNKKTKGFFKLFIPESSSQNMKIPTAFTKYMGGKLPRKVFLRDRYKNMWQVEVGKSGNHLFFEEGWVKFIKDNYVELGDFLVFDCIDAKSLFDFKLLGHTFCEKIGVGRPNFLVKEEVKWEQSDGLENEDEHPEEEEEGEEWELSDGLEDEDKHLEDKEEEWDQSNELDLTTNNDTTINVNNTLEDQDEHEHEEEKEEEEDGDGEDGRAAPRVLIGNRPSRKAVDYCGANIFKSGLYPQPENPYFMTKIRKGRKDELHIPKHVISDFNLKLPPKMILRDPRGKEWEAKVKTWKDNRVLLAGGWRQLCRWNLIDEEDSCICEFVSEERGMGRKELLLQIHAVRGPQA